MIFYTVYRTQNLVNGKYYFGVHKTKNPYDGYLGSGKILRRAITKYGERAFLKNICFVFDNPTEAFEKEFELIETYRIDPLCYNLRQGGGGGFDYINREGLSGYHQGAVRMNIVLAERFKTNPIYRERIKKSIAHASKFIKPGTHRGELNARFGKKWMYHPVEKQCKPVPPRLLNEYLAQGWLVGRKMKF